MGKGSRRRPAAVDRRTLEQRWASINWNVDNEDVLEPVEGGTRRPRPTKEERGCDGRGQAR